MKDNEIIKSLKVAFPYTLPILAGFWFLGLTYGIYMNVSGFNFIYPMIMSMTIFGGSVEFIIVNLLLVAFNPIQTFIITFMVNARHLFYGISMLKRYQGLGWKKIFLIFGLCDESFSINYTVAVPEGVDRGWFYFWITFLNYSYWVTGATLGGIFGSFITFNIEGLGFVMTSMFVVIFMEQWMKENDHRSSLIGLGVSLLSLVLLGSDGFMIPAMIAIVGLLSIFKDRLAPNYLKEEV